MTAIIVDHEFRSTEMIEWLLETYFPKMKVIGKYDDLLQGLHGIHRLKPELLFLDIQLPMIMGLDFLSKPQINSLNVIFLTAYKGRVLEVLGNLQLPYLLKPVDHDEFKNLVERAINGKLQALSSKTIEMLLKMSL